MSTDSLKQQPSIAPATVQPARASRGFTILDNLMFIAGFACGFVLHQNSAFRARGYYLLPAGMERFQSLLGLPAVGWLWAMVVGLVFLVVGRCFRRGGRIRPSEWLSVSLAILLVDSAIPAYMPAGDGYFEWLLLRADSPETGVPTVYWLSSLYDAASRESQRAFALN